MGQFSPLNGDLPGVVRLSSIDLVSRGFVRKLLKCVTIFCNKTRLFHPDSSAACKYITHIHTETFGHEKHLDFGRSLFEACGAKEIQRKFHRCDKSPYREEIGTRAGRNINEI